MSFHVSRSERVERQSLDDGDQDDTVWLSNGTGAYVYHEESSCPRLENPDDETRRAAQLKWLAPCERCCLDGGGAS